MASEDSTSTSFFFSLFCTSSPLNTSRWLIESLMARVLPTFAPRWQLPRVRNSRLRQTAIPLGSLLLQAPQRQFPLLRKMKVDPLSLPSSHSEQQKFRSSSMSIPTPCRLPVTECTMPWYLAFLQSTVLTPVNRDSPCMCLLQLQRLDQGQQQTEWWAVEEEGERRERMSLLRSRSFMPHSEMTEQEGAGGRRGEGKRGDLENLDFDFLREMELSKREYWTGRGLQVPTGGNFIFICCRLWLFFLSFYCTHFGPLWSLSSPFVLYQPTPGHQIDPLMELSRQVATSALLRLPFTFPLGSTSTWSYIPAAGTFLFFSQVCISSKMVLRGGDCTFNLAILGEFSLGS